MSGLALFAAGFILGGFLGLLVAASIRGAR